MSPETQIKPNSSSRKALILALFCLVCAAGVISLFLARPAAASSNAGSLFVHQLNLLGYEGIGTIGVNLASNGEAPPVGDYVTTHCRYINVPNTAVGEYYLRYPLHLPDGASITKLEFQVADFNSSGVLWAYLRSRDWNSRAAGDLHGFTLTDNTTDSDKVISLTPKNGALPIDNTNKSYWIDVSPVNSADPGQLCVYGIQVTYTTNGVALPVIVR